MKKLLLLCALLLAATASFAQTESEKRSALHISFVPPLSTHGSMAAEYTNGVSFSVLAGVSRNVEFFGLAGLVNIIKNDARGVQIAGLLNRAGNNGNGVMFGGLANLVKNDYKGWQFGGLANTSDRLEGVQFGGLGNLAGDIKGGQFGGLGNMAGDVTGFQVGGLFNVAKDVSGAQFAGLINIAKSSDCQIALINIIRDGEYGISVSYSEIGSVVATFRSGGRVTYGILGVGYNHKTADTGFVIEGGIGVHVNVVSWLRINNEAKSGSTGNFSDGSTFYFNYALLPAFRLSRNLEIFGGPSINFMQSDNVGNKSMFPGNSIWKKHTASKLQQVYVGWQTGVQFIF